MRWCDGWDSDDSLVKVGDNDNGVICMEAEHPMVVHNNLAVSRTYRRI